MVGGGVPFLGRYLTPVAGQVDLVPSIYYSNYKRVLNTMRGFGEKKRHTRISSNELASRHAAQHVEMVPNFIQFTLAATDGDWTSIYGRQSSLDRGGCIGC